MAVGLAVILKAKITHGFHPDSRKSIEKWELERSDSTRIPTLGFFVVKNAGIGAYLLK